MLRKSSHIILSTLLLFATVGLTISKHYCGEDYVSTSIFGESESCCDSNNCCKNESETFQLDEDFSIVSVSEVPQTSEFELLDLAILFYNFALVDSEKTEEFLEADLPPPPKIQTSLSKRQTYLL